MSGETLPSGHVLGRLIGRGGMGSVHEAAIPGNEARFAVKLLHPELATRQKSVARFRREARILSELEHEHVVRVFGAGAASSGAPYLVMELLEGETLRRVLAREGPLTAGRTVDLVSQCCRGLIAAHARGVIHRDLKPENLFVSRRDDGSDWVKILDFGIAKLHDAGKSITETSAGVLVGTLAYMAPEQVRGESGLDARVDVYALGCILYECLTGRRAHPGKRAHEVLYHVLHARPATLSALCPGLPPALVELCERAFTPERERRLASAEELLARLSGLSPDELEQVPRAARGAISRGDDLTLTAPTDEPLTTSTSRSLSREVADTQRTKRRLGPWPTFLGGVAVTLLLGVVAQPTPERAAPPGQASRSGGVAALPSAPPTAEPGPKPGPAPAPAATSVKARPKARLEPAPAVASSATLPLPKTGLRFERQNPYQ